VQDVHDAALRDDALRRDPSRVTEPGSEFDDFFRREQPKMVALAIALTGVPEVARDLAAGVAREGVSRVAVGAGDGQAWRVAPDESRSTPQRRGTGRTAVPTLRTRGLGGPGAVEMPERETDRFWAAVRALPDRQRRSCRAALPRGPADC
jgi:hypothetical protein